MSLDQEVTIVRLKAEKAELLAALEEVSRVITVEHSLHPDYGWGSWLKEHVLPAIAKAKP